MHKNSEASESNSRSVLLWAVLFLPLAYILSIGPAAKLQAHGMLPEKVTNAMYAPLEPLCRNETFMRGLLWYLAYVWRVPIDL